METFQKLTNWFAGGFSLNVGEQLAAYGAFHQDPRNQLIHLIFVPVLWGTGCAGLAYTKPLFKGAPYWMNWSFLAYLGYAGFYFALDAETALPVNIIYGCLFAWINRLVQRERTAKTGASAKPKYKKGTIGKIALVVHILSWYMQIHPGHAVFEGRKPAITTSFMQSLVLAPLFVFYEAIWFLFPGYKPELHAEMARRIAEQNAIWAAAK